MASVKIFFDKISMDGEINVKLGFSALPVALYLLTAVYSAAATQASELLFFAHLANMMQLSIWEADLEKHISKSNQDNSRISCTSQSCRMKFCPSFVGRRSIALFFVSLTPCLFAILKSRNVLVAFGLLVIGLRSSLALARFWLSPDQLQSPLFDYLALFTGFKLCKVACAYLGIKSCGQPGEDEWEVIDRDASDEDS